MTPGQTENGSLIVMKKELRLLFKSKRRIFLLFLMPIVIILIFIFASLSANFFGASADPTHIWVINDSPSVHTDNLMSMWGSINDTELEVIDADYMELKEALEFDVLVWFPQNFTNLIENQNTSMLFLSYNGNESSHEIVASTIFQYTNIYEQQLIVEDNPNVEFNRISPQIEQVQEDKKGVSKEIANTLIIIPVYIIFFIVIPPISLILISVTIEREQKTLETLLLQPVKRRSVVIGKILYGLSLVAITMILDIISVLIGFNVLVRTINEETGEIGRVITDGIKSLGAEPIIMFLLAIFVIAMNIIALSVLLSLLAKDEKEANMISGLIPLFLFGIIAVVYVIPIADLTIVVQTILSAVPIMGVIIAIYLSTIAGEVVLLAYVSLLTQILWAGLFIWITTRISEAESILELTWGKAIREVINSIFRRS